MELNLQGQITCPYCEHLQEDCFVKVDDTGGIESQFVTCLNETCTQIFAIAGQVKFDGGTFEADAINKFWDGE